MSNRTYSASDLVALLASALGGIQAKTVVDAALERVGARGTGVFGADVARKALTDVAAQPGLVGITGRIALSRLDLGSATSGETASPARRKRPLAVVTKLLTPALGEVRAAAAVGDAAAALSIDASEEIDLTQALSILEALASTTGVTSAAARFAKSRIHLTW